MGSYLLKAQFEMHFLGEHHFEYFHEITIKEEELIQKVCLRKYIKIKF